MIVGVVSPQHEATIRVQVRAANGQGHEIDVILDTGFSGSLTLPPSLIAALNLPFRARGSGTLADGSETEFDIHAVTIIWDGTERPLLVEPADTEPLIGMRLLYGNAIHIEAVDGGTLTIQPLSH